MAVLTGTSGQVKIGTTTDTAVGEVNSWTATFSKDAYVQKSLGVAYTTRVFGHTDVSGTLDIDLDHSDTELSSLLSEGSSFTFLLYSDKDTPKYFSGTGYVESYTITVGAQKNNASIAFTGGGAWSLT